jgi:hypothetical protein
MSTGVSQILSDRKFKDEPIMPFTKTSSQDSSSLREMAYGWGKIASRRTYGEEGPGLDVDFDTIESMAVDVAQSVVRGAIEDVLKTQSKRLGDHQPCPGCSRPCPVGKKSRPIQVRGATIKYDEPVCHCPACRRDFFPAPPELEARLARIFADDRW